MLWPPKTLIALKEVSVISLRLPTSHAELGATEGSQRWTLVLTRPISPDCGAITVPLRTNWSEELVAKVNVLKYQVSTIVAILVASTIVQGAGSPPDI